MGKLEQIVQILSDWLRDWEQVSGENKLFMLIGLVIAMVLTSLVIGKDRDTDTRRMGIIKSLALIAVALILLGWATGFFGAMSAIINLIGGWVKVAIVIAGFFAALLMRKYRAVQIFATMIVIVMLSFSWYHGNMPWVSHHHDDAPVVVVQPAGDQQDNAVDSEVVELRQQLANVIARGNSQSTDPDDKSEFGFVQGDFDLDEVVRMFIIVVIVLVTFLRMYQAFAGVMVDGRRVCQKQWLVTLSPKTKKPESYDIMQGNLLFFWLPTLLFVLFNLTLVVIFVSPRWIFNGGWSFLILPLWLIGQYFISTMIKLQTAHKLVYEWGASDVYHPWFYLWRKENGQHTLYAGELLNKLYRGTRSIEYKYLRGYRKGIHFSIVSVWFPSDLLRAYIYKEEVLEINTYKSAYYATAKKEWPETDAFDGQTPEELKNVGESGPEVCIDVNLSVWKYVDPEPFLPMADEDRLDEVNFVKRKIVDPILALFFSRGTKNQFVGAGMMRSPNFRIKIGGESLTVEEALRKELLPYGWDVRSIKFGDCNPSEEMIKAQDELAQLEVDVQKAKEEAKALREKSKGEGDALLNTLQPLIAAIKTDPTQVSMAMAYEAQRTLYNSQNRIIAVAPDMQGLIQQLLKTLQGITGINPALNPPTS